jgi:hypothetical protein
MMNDIIASGTIHSIKSIFQKKTEHNVIIDPFSCLIKLSLLRFLDSGTKISINQNSLCFNSPTYIQGIVRFMYGDNREHLHNLYLPIQKCVEWFWDELNTDMIYIFNNAVIGLKMLKQAYSEYATIQHTIDYYIIILMQKNATLIAKMGISSLNIENLTNELLDETTHINTNLNAQTNNSNSNNTTSTNTTNTTSTSSNSSNSNKNKNKNQNQNKESTNKDSQSKEKESISTINYEDETNFQNDKVNKKQSNRLKDIHRFLFDMWNKREIDIVINLYKELENKQHTDDKNSIYTNIMNYCSMKELKLHKYIEQNSSVL